jgi:hypothetical protein
LDQYASNPILKRIDDLRLTEAPDSINPNLFSGSAKPPVIGKRFESKRKTDVNFIPMSYSNYEEYVRDNSKKNKKEYNNKE